MISKLFWICSCYLLLTPLAFSQKNESNITHKRDSKLTSPTAGLTTVDTKGKVQISGQVLEKGTKKPLAEVNVFILPSGLKAVTDSTGNFSFSNLQNASGEWIVNLPGYKRLKQDFNFEGSKAGLKLYIEKNTYVELETTVTAQTKKTDPAKTTLDQSEFLKAPGSGGDPIRALENLPGVLQSFNANVAVQGSPPEDTRYLIEGHEIPFIFHFFGLNTVAVPETVEAIDFLAAGYNAKYGRASSGVINLELRSPRTDRPHAMGFVDFTALGGFYEGPISKDSHIFVGGRYSYVGELIKLGAENFGDDDNPAPTFNTAPTYFDINTTYVKNLNSRSNFSFIGLVSQDKVGVVSADADNPTFSGTIEGVTEFFRLIPKYEYQLSKNKLFTTSLGGGIDRSIFEPGQQRLLQTSTVVTWRADLAHQVTDRYHLKVGTDFLFEKFDLDSRISQSFFTRGDVNPPFEAAELLITKTSGQELRQGYYLINDYELIPNQLVLSPQIRIDHFQLHDEWAVQPRGGIRYYLDNSSSLYLSSGLYVQPEPIVNLLESSGNPDLTPSRSIHYSLRYDKDFREGRLDGFQLRSSLFFKRLKNIVVDSNALTTREGVTVPERFNNKGNGTSEGLELLIKFRKNRLNAHLGYTLTISRRTDPSTGQEFPSEQDQTHNLNMTLAQSWSNYSLSTRFRYVTGLPFTPFQSSVYDENSDVYIPISGDRLSRRLKDFWQIDIRVDRKWIYDTWILSAYLDIQNLTNRKNEVGKVYNFDFTQSDSSLGLPILPTFGIKGEF